MPQWDIILDGKKIGEIHQKRIGRNSSIFFHAFVLVEGRLVDIELNTDFDDRADRILAAHLDPMSNRHVRYWTGH